MRQVLHSKVGPNGWDVFSTLGRLRSGIENKVEKFGSGRGVEISHGDIRLV